MAGVELATLHLVVPFEATLKMWPLYEPITMLSKRSLNAGDESVPLNPGSQQPGPQ